MVDYSIIPEHIVRCEILSYLGRKRFNVARLRYTNRSGSLYDRYTDRLSFDHECSHLSLEIDIEEFFDHTYPNRVSVSLYTSRPERHLIAFSFKSDCEFGCMGKCSDDLGKIVDNLMAAKEHERGIKYNEKYSMPNGPYGRRKVKCDILDIPYEELSDIIKKDNEFRNGALERMEKIAFQFLRKIDRGEISLSEIN